MCAWEGGTHVWCPSHFFIHSVLCVLGTSSRSSSVPKRRCTGTGGVVSVFRGPCPVEDVAPEAVVMQEGPGWRRAPGSRDRDGGDRLACAGPGGLRSWEVPSGPDGLPQPARTSQSCRGHRRGRRACGRTPSAPQTWQSRGAFPQAARGPAEPAGFPWETETTVEAQAPSPPLVLGQACADP